MSTDAEKIAKIAALMTEPGADGIYRWRVGHVRRRIKAILAEPDGDRETPLPSR